MRVLSRHPPARGRLAHPAGAMANRCRGVHCGDCSTPRPSRFSRSVPKRGSTRARRSPQYDAKNHMKTAGGQSTERPTPGATDRSEGAHRTARCTPHVKQPARSRRDSSRYPGQGRRAAVFNALRPSLGASSRNVSRGPAEKSRRAAGMSRPGPRQTSLEGGIRAAVYDSLRRVVPHGQGPGRHHHPGRAAASHGLRRRAPTPTPDPPVLQ